MTMRRCPACDREVYVERTKVSGEIIMRVMHKAPSICGGISTGYESRTTADQFADGIGRQLTERWNRVES